MEPCRASVETVFGQREAAVAHFTCIGLESALHAAVASEEVLHEAGRAGVQPQQVVHDQHLRVGRRASANADYGDGESGAPPGTNRTVTLAWAPNHETGVNSTGGGYQVAISGQPALNVPFTSGLAAPTYTVTTLQTGTYTVTVSAFAALDEQGGGTGSLSEPSQPFTVIVR